MAGRNHPAQSRLCSVLAERPESCGRPMNAVRTVRMTEGGVGAARPAMRCRRGIYVAWRCHGNRAACNETAPQPNSGPIAAFRNQAANRNRHQVHEPQALRKACRHAQRTQNKCALCSIRPPLDQFPGYFAKGFDRCAMPSRSGRDSDPRPAPACSRSLREVVLDRVARSSDTPPCCAGRRNPHRYAGWCQRRHHSSCERPRFCCPCILSLNSCQRVGSPGSLAVCFVSGCDTIRRYLVVCNSTSYA